MTSLIFGNNLAEYTTYLSIFQGLHRNIHLRVGVHCPLNFAAQDPWDLVHLGVDQGGLFSQSFQHHVQLLLVELV